MVKKSLLAIIIASMAIVSISAMQPAPYQALPNAWGPQTPAINPAASLDENALELARRKQNFIRALFTLNIDELKKLIGKDTINFRYLGETPLMYATKQRALNPEERSQWENIIDLLLESGADKKATDFRGRTAYDMAVEDNIPQEIANKLKP